MSIRVSREALTTLRLSRTAVISAWLKWRKKMICSRYESWIRHGVSGADTEAWPGMRAWLACGSGASSEAIATWRANRCCRAASHAAGSSAPAGVRATRSARSAARSSSRSLGAVSRSRVPLRVACRASASVMSSPSASRAAAPRSGSDLVARARRTLIARAPEDRRETAIIVGAGDQHRVFGRARPRLAIRGQRL